MNEPKEQKDRVSPKRTSGKVRLLTAEDLLNRKLQLCADERLRRLVTADHMLRLTQRLVRQEVTLSEARYIAQRLPTFVSLTNDLLKTDAAALPSSPAVAGGGSIIGSRRCGSPASGCGG